MFTQSNNIAIVDGVDALAVGEVADLGDVQQTVGARGQVHEGAEGGGLHDLAVVGLAGFRHVRVGDLVDDLLGLLGGLAAFGGDVHGAVILDGDFGAGVFLDLVDHLALRSDDLADLVHRNGGGDDARRVRAHLGRAVDALVDDFEDGGAGFLGLLQSGRQDVGRNAVELGVELQGGDEFGGIFFNKISNSDNRSLNNQEILYYGKVKKSILIILLFIIAVLLLLHKIKYAMVIMCSIILVAFLLILDEAKKFFHFYKRLHRI